MRLLLPLLCLVALSLTALAADPTPPKVGDKAPNFTLPTANVSKNVPGKKDGDKVSLEDLKGKNVVLFFFPKAMTPGCTAQCKGFTKLRDEFARLDTVVIGISTDTLAAQEKFTSNDSLTIPLMADAEKEIAKTYGVLNPTRGFANRVTFVIDKKGIVRKITSVLIAAGDPQETLKYVKENLAGK
jgi:peroxiredoxin Q/BCP